MSDDSIPTAARTWEDVERLLTRLSRPAVAAVAARAASRAAPAVARLADRYGPEAWEWFNAVSAAVRTVNEFARGGTVSRFALDVAAELARCAATATANAARARGPSPLVADAELAYAAAAFAADAARTGTDSRAATLAMQAARAAAGGGEVPAEQRLDLRTLAGLPPGPVDPSDAGPLGELWPAGEPDGWAEAWAGLEERRPGLPLLLALPDAV